MSDDGRITKIHRPEVPGSIASLKTSSPNGHETPYTDDYYPYTKKQLERCYAARRYDDHKRAWNTYYQSNTINGYKDRHYILREFTELNEALTLTSTSSATSSSAISQEEKSVRWLEIGCGVGNAVMPALKEYPCLRVLGFDISPVAIGLFNKKAVEEGLSDRINICVTNLAETDVPEGFLTKDRIGTCHSSDSEGTVDFASIIFVLSAVPRSKHALFLQRSRRLMHKGAVLFFRDYYENDMAQKRFSDENKIDDTTFFRVDGTLSHFFSKAEIDSLFCPANGFELIEEKVVEREVENRKDKNTMQRRWYQGRFRCV